MKDWNSTQAICSFRSRVKLSPCLCVSIDSSESWVNIWQTNKWSYCVFNFHIICVRSPRDIFISFRLDTRARIRYRHTVYTTKYNTTNTHTVATMDEYREVYIARDIVLQRCVFIYMYVVPVWTIQTTTFVYKTRKTAKNNTKDQTFWKSVSNGQLNRQHINSTILKFYESTIYFCKFFDLIQKRFSCYIDRTKKNYERRIKKILRIISFPPLLKVFNLNLFIFWWWMSARNN